MELTRYRIEENTSFVLRCRTGNYLYRNTSQFLSKLESYQNGEWLAYGRTYPRDTSIVNAADYPKVMMALRSKWPKEIVTTKMSLANKF